MLGDLVSYNSIRNSGATAITTIVAMILLLVGIVIVYAIIMYIPDLAEQLWEIITGTGADDLEEEPVEQTPIVYNLADAVTCAYYRCEYGCNSEEIEDVYVETGTGMKSCKYEYCAPFSGDDGKACTNSETVGPIRVALLEEQSLYVDELSFADCLGWSQPIWHEEKYSFVGGDRAVVFVHVYTISEFIGENACETEDSFNVFYEQLLLKTGSYNIYSSDFSDVGGGVYVLVASE